MHLAKDVASSAGLEIQVIKIHISTVLTPLSYNGLIDLFRYVGDSRRTGCKYIGDKTSGRLRSWKMHRICVL